MSADAANKSASQLGGTITPTRAKRPTWGPGEVEVGIDWIDDRCVVSLRVEERDFAIVHLTHKEAHDLANLLWSTCGLMDQIMPMPVDCSSCGGMSDARVARKIGWRQLPSGQWYCGHCDPAIPLEVVGRFSGMLPKISKCRRCCRAVGYHIQQDLIDAGWTTHTGQHWTCPQCNEAVRAAKPVDPVTDDDTTPAPPHPAR